MSARPPFPYGAAALIVLTLLLPPVALAAEIYEDSFLEFEIPEGGSVHNAVMGEYHVFSAPDAALAATLVTRIRLGSNAPAARDLAEAVASAEATITEERYPNLAIEAREKISIAGDTEAVAYTYTYLEQGDATRHRKVRAVYAAHAGHIIEVRCETSEEEFERTRPAAERVLKTLRLYP